MIRESSPVSLSCLAKGNFDLTPEKSIEEVEIEQNFDWTFKPLRGGEIMIKPAPIGQERRQNGQQATKCKIFKEYGEVIK